VENAREQAKPHPQRTYSLVDWVCGHMMAPVTCIRDGRGQGQTYADSAATIDAPTPPTSQQPITSSALPLENQALEKSASAQKSPTKQNSDQWNWIGMKAALKVRSSDLNMFAPQSM
jgi:hypothetical protein